MSTKPRTLVDLDDSRTWHPDLIAFLESHYDLFADWEVGEKRFSARDYDAAVYRLVDQLQPYALRGWHCTRLTDQEIDDILANGFHLPNREMLHRRVDTLIANGTISQDVGDRLKERNQADAPNRAGMIWFCFHPPGEAGESGIERFFRHWGGEALYGLHERDPVTSPVLAQVGTPCVVEALVPIATLKVHGGLYTKVIRRFLADRGDAVTEPTDHQDRAIQPLPASVIEGIHRFPDPQFLRLTGCQVWRRKIQT